jgi:hypothetical protein
MLGGCTLFGWTPPGGTRGDVAREDAVLRAIMVAEEHITEPMYDVLGVRGRGSVRWRGRPRRRRRRPRRRRCRRPSTPIRNDCLAETARLDLQAYAQIRKTATARYEAFFEAAERYNQLKYDSFAPLSTARSCRADGRRRGPRHPTRLRCGLEPTQRRLLGDGDGCLEQGGRAVAEAARAAVEEAGLRVATVEPGCEKDYLSATSPCCPGTPRSAISSRGATSTARPIAPSSSTPRTTG